MSQLILDLSDPAVAEMVSNWADGGQYRIELLVTQKPADGNIGPYDVNEITDYGEAEPMEKEIPAAKEAGGLPRSRPAPAPTPASGIPA